MALKICSGFPLLDMIEDRIQEMEEGMQVAGDSNDKVVEWGKRYTDSSGNRFREMRQKRNVNLFRSFFIVFLKSFCMNQTMKWLSTKSSGCVMQLGGSSPNLKIFWDHDDDARTTLISLFDINVLLPLQFLPEIYIYSTVNKPWPFLK